MVMMFFLIFCIFEIFHNTKKELGEGDTDTAISARVSISLSFCFSFVPSWEVNLGPVNGSGDLFSWTPSLSPSTPQPHGLSECLHLAPGEQLISDETAPGALLKVLSQSLVNPNCQIRLNWPNWTRLVRPHELADVVHV